jgi:hypothetical protein
MPRSRRAVALISAALTLAPAWARAVAEEKSMNERVHHMKRVQVIDRSGFERPLPAITMLIPSDWTFESQVVYGKGTCGALFALSFRAQSPDGKTGIELFPAYSWQWADDPQMRQLLQQQNEQNARFHRPGCDVMPTMSAADFLTKVVAPKLRPGARLHGAEHLPDLHESLVLKNQQMQAQMQQLGLRGKVTLDDARLRISYEQDGAPLEEWLTATVTVHATPMPVFNRGQMGQSVSYGEEAQMLFALRAPAGELDAKQRLYELVLSTMRVEPEWQQRIQQVQGNIQAANQKGIADRAAIQRKSAEDTARIRSETYAQKQEAQAQSHQQFSQYLRGVETYKDPNSGEKVELDSRYGHAWSNGNGEYILSESPDFDPNQHTNGNWTQLQQVRP